MKIFLALLLCLAGQGAVADDLPPAAEMSSPSAQKPAAPEAAVLPAQPPAGQEDLTPSYEVKHKWTTLEGKPLPVDLPMQSQWVWVRSDYSIPVKTPRLRTWVQLPPGVKLVEMKQDSDFTLDRRPDLSPFKEWKQDQFAIDLGNSSGTGIFTFRNPQGKVDSFVLMLEVKVTAPSLLYENARCAQQGVTIDKQALRGGFMFIGVNCRDEGDSELVFVFHSSDSKWVDTDIDGMEYNGGFWKQFRVPKPREPIFDTRLLGRFRVTDQKGAGTSEVALRYTPPGEYFPLHFSLGVGLTSIAYSEEIHRINLSQISLTPKAGVNYRLVPSGLEFGANAFATLANYNVVAVSSVGIPAALFYGFNLRGGMRFHNDAGTADFSALLGYYFTGMAVPDQVYGFKHLSGPQVFLMARKARLRRPVYYGYFKLAPISDNLGEISLSNREVAIGGGYQINSPKSPEDWMLTLDLSDAQFHSNAAGNGMKLLTITAGVMMAL